MFYSYEITKGVFFVVLLEFFWFCFFFVCLLFLWTAGEVMERI